ncbi:transporter [Halovenus sp. WSH3]|uniref:Transporter n=1 Tax=Halovenus carboxidivorans TaxID=2692199 RepID=A0A6B0T4H5_9EURY|nr:CopD family protein [Halovenus carboxidivorans]MXR53158.1 transporter [Halovenus carboxidivorans]
MSVIDASAYVIHSVFAGLWTGSILFMTLGVLPLAVGGKLDAEPLRTVTGRFKTLSRTSVLLLFLTGGHMAGTQYTGATLTGSTSGYLVLSMLSLWFLTAGLTEVGASRLSDGSGRDKVREPGRNARRFFQAGSVSAVLLLVVAGLLSAAGAGLL